MTHKITTPLEDTTYYEYEHSLGYYLEQSFQKNAENIAYVFEDEELTYGELDELVNAFAQILIKKNIKKGDIVFVALENSLELPISYLACIRIGAIFTPIDLKWPQKRQELLLENIDPECIISHDASMFKDALIIDLEFLRLQKKDSTFNAESVQIASNDAIYGFFTSGSTGVPKCTINIHKGIVNRFMYMNKVFQIHPKNDVILQNSNVAFDSSLWQLLWPLLNGCKIVIPVKKNYLDFEATIALIEKHQITMTDFVPSIFTLLLDTIEVNAELIHRLSSLKSIIIGGEESHTTLINRFFSFFPSIQLVNTYGHTEASIGMVFHIMKEKLKTSKIPLGTPIDNTYVVIADENQQPLKVGEMGEIYVGGVCIGGGYYKDEVKNKQTFIKNPFPKIPGAKIYRTGDYGYYGTDGLLYYKGRKDEQIKIAGVRVELSEIEACARALEEVNQAKAIFIKEKQTVHLFVKSNNLEVKVMEAKVTDLLKEKLPKVAMPSKIVIVKDFPLNLNGKIDLQKLKAIDKEAEVVTKKNESSLYSQVIRLFKEILDLDEIDTSKSFFEQGGTSILAIKFIIALEKLFQTKVSLEKLYENFTVDEILIQLNTAATSLNAPQPKSSSKQFFIQDYIGLKDFMKEQSIAQNKSSQEGILLTGATGCFGAQLLCDLLEQTNVPIYCLVRSEGLSAAFEKMECTWEKYGLHEIISKTLKIIPIVGDLSEDYWGLGAHGFNELSKKIGMVIHNAAEVDLVREYNSIRQTNVLSMKYLLKFCTMNDLKPIHYISTISVFSEKMFDYYGVVPEKILYDFSYMPNGGYNQSKWLAEKILSESRALNLPISIYRFGEITANTQTGIANKKSLLDMFINAMVYLKCYPNSSMKIDYFPADVASKLVITNLKNDNQEVNAVNVGGFSFHEFAQMLNKYSVFLTQVSYTEFYQKLVQAITQKGVPEYLQALFYLIPNPETNMHNNDPISSIFFKDLNRVSVRNLANSKGFEQNKLNDFNNYVKRIAH